MNEPSGGIMLGYFLADCASSSSTVSFGPGYRRGLMRRAACDGGLKRVGFSKIRDLSVTGALLEAGRMAVVFGRSLANRRGLSGRFMSRHGEVKKRCWGRAMMDSMRQVAIVRLQHKLCSMCTS